jgi:hypothetical protein
LAIAVTASIVFAAQHAALQLEIREAVMVLRRLGEADDRFWRHRFPMAQIEPGGLAGLALDIGQVGLAPIADEEEIAERLYARALLALAEQGCHR